MTSELTNWDGELLISKYDSITGSWIFIAIHSTKLGPATGGTRMMQYNSQDDAIQDVLQLAKGMTLKFALANFPRGGGKAVIAIKGKLPVQDRIDLLRRYGKLILQLNGLFYSGADIGTSSTDMDIISETAAPFIFSRTPENGGAGSSAKATAYGVLVAIESTMAYMNNDSSLKNKTILVQGAGKVGEQLINLLRHEEAIIYFSDTDEVIAKKMCQNDAVIFVHPNNVYETNCDVFAPCALGGILNNQTIPLLKCRAVVGAANNQLAAAGDALLLKQHNILYAPDFAVNVGGALAITGMETMGWTEQKAMQEVGKIYNTLQKIYIYAEQFNITTEEAALKLATQNI